METYNFTAINMFKNFKKRHCRKNSKNRAFLKIRCNHTAPDSIFWQYFLEVVVDNKLKEQIQITGELYETMKLNSIEESNYEGITFHTLIKFEPTINQK